MNFKKLVGLTVSALALSLIILGDANAAGVSVKCEVRSGRSKASVDGTGVSGLFYAKLKSGLNVAKSKNLRADPITREVEFDFDSNLNDIRAGATAIAPNFIKNATVVGTIYKASDNSVVGSARGFCRVK